jgi:hypothetical protein
MIRHRWSCWGALACALALALPCAAAPVPGDQDKPLAQVPAKAPIVAQLRGFERTRDRLDALLKNAMPDFAAVARQKMDDALKQALNGRKLEGMTKDGPIFLVFTELPNPNQDPPKMAILVPVKSYKEFRDGLLTDDERKGLKPDPIGYESTNIEGTQTYFVDRKNGYAAVTPDADVAAFFAKKFDGLGGKLSKSVAQHLMDADASLYVDMAAVNKEHGEQIKQAQTQMEAVFDNLPNKDVGELLKRVYAPLFQATSDSTAYLVSADLRPEGVLLHVEVEVSTDSKTNGTLKQWKSLPVADLGKLPAGQMIYSGVAATPALLKEVGPFLYGVGNDPDSKESKAVHKMVAELAAAKPSQQLTAASVPAGGLVAVKYDDPAKAVAAQLKMYKELKEGWALGAVLKAAPAIKEKAEKYGGFEFNSIGLKWDLEKTVEKQAAALNDDQKKALVESLKGLIGEGSDVWIGTDGKTVLQVTAKDWSAAKALIDSYQKGDGSLGKSQAYKDTVKHLPPNSSVTALIDVPQGAETGAKFVVGLMQGMGLGGQLPPGFDGKPAAKAKTSYLGIGVAMESGRGSLDLWVPAVSVNDIYKMYIEKLVKPNF